MTLRQRNRLEAVRRITDTAITLFDARGYNEVTVEEIAEAAGVSPRTFYRYFGTKEGLFTVDAHSAAGMDGIEELVDPGDLPGTMERIIAFIQAARFEDGGYTPWRGMRHVLEQPAVRAAVYGAGDAMCERFAALLQSHGEDPTRARVIARSYWFGVYFGALEQWYRDGQTGPVDDYVRRALSVLPGAGASAAVTAPTV